MVMHGDYPSVVELVSEYEHHCCVDDYLAGRKEYRCEEGP